MKKVINILLIDDDPVTNMINTKLISRNYNFNVSAYTNAREALDRFRALPNSSTEFPDIIFLDINMPEMDGWEFLSAFQNLPTTVYGKCDVFMLTSSIDLGDMEKCRSYTCVREFISKPLTTDKLKMLLRNQSIVD